MTGLTAALVDWRPNFLQLLVSEIQNRLELESVATDPKVFSEASRQVGLSHYLLEELAGNEDPESAVESVIDRIVETLRHRISGDRPMRELATKVLGVSGSTWAKSLRRARSYPGRRLWPMWIIRSTPAPSFHFSMRSYRPRRSRNLGSPPERYLAPEMIIGWSQRLLAT